MSALPLFIPLLRISLPRSGGWHTPCVAWPSLDLSDSVRPCKLQEEQEPGAAAVAACMATPYSRVDGQRCLLVVVRQPRLSSGSSGLPRSHVQLHALHCSHCSSMPCIAHTAPPHSYYFLVSRSVLPPSAYPPLLAHAAPCCNAGASAASACCACRSLPACPGCPGRTSRSGVSCHRGHHFSATVCPSPKPPPARHHYLAPSKPAQQPPYFPMWSCLLLSFRAGCCWFPRALRSQGQK